MAATYILEATLYTGQHLQSDPIHWDQRDYLSCATLQQLRAETMVEAVAVIQLETAEVVADLPSFNCLARARQDKLTSMSVPRIRYRVA